MMDRRASQTPLGPGSLSNTDQVPTLEQVQAAIRPIPSDAAPTEVNEAELRRCPRCQHWHHPLVACEMRPMIPPQEIASMLVDHRCELRSLFAVIQAQTQIIAGMSIVVRQLEYLHKEELDALPEPGSSDED